MKVSFRFVSILLLSNTAEIAVGAMTILSGVMQFAICRCKGLPKARSRSATIISARNGERVGRTFRLLLRKQPRVFFRPVGAGTAVSGRVRGLFTNDAALLAFTAKALRVYCGALCLFGAQGACQMTLYRPEACDLFDRVAILRKFVTHPAHLSIRA